ncbi:MAG: DUF389 domain-containing protein [Bacteroidales bacterium]|nr:DUF389 domain-containing protein [Bacteroidales bacterium]
MYSADHQVENEPQPTNEQPQPKSKGRSLKEKFIVFWGHVRRLFRIYEDTDVAATVAAIQKSVEFKGINLWLLGFAILVASVGLNVNSTAVIIGAMLISPLMGPINGVGLAVGTYDWELLKKSFNNLLLMVIISLLVSTLYFLLSPLGDAQSELLARTRPTIYDVLIATFGGLAGIVAASRRDMPFTVVSGVAIATALMPPLCTAGYGIATWQLRYAFGAFYLFFINSFFIALATFIMVRYLRFPKHKFLNTNRERIVKRGILILSILVIIPSFFTAINVVRETVFNTQANKFVSELRDGKYLKTNQQLVNVEKDYDRKNPMLTLTIVGDEVSPVMVDSLRSIMRHNFGLTSTDLKVKQTGLVFNAEMQAGQLGKMIADKDKEIKQKDKEIAALSVSTEQNRKIAKQIGDEFSSSIASVSVSSMSYYSTSSKNSVNETTVIVTWKENADRSAVTAELNRMLPFMLQVPQVKIISAN